MPMLVEVQNLHKSHPSPSGAQGVDILKGLDFSLEDGATTAIVGPSGSGKSTFLNILGTLDTFDSGSVVVGGQDIRQLKDRELAAYRNRTIGFVFQMHHLLPQCTVLENVLAPSLAAPSLDRKALQSRACELLDSLGLAHRLDHRPGELSGGERQRVAVARAMVLSPKVLLADEPTGALDRAAAENLGELLLEMNRKHKVALIVVTHSRELAAHMQAVFELKYGKLVKTA
ncbi:MAG: ABC transporter ATP-binding protein [Verrucomicrobiota bacterium]